MKNLKVLLEIITELKSENKELKESKEVSSDSLNFWYKKAESLAKELDELKEQSLTIKTA